MTKVQGKALFIALAFFAILLPLGAQNLLEDNPHARRARDLRILADRAFNEGNYEDSIAYTEEAEKERALAVTWAEEQVWAFRANSMRNRAREQIVYANRIDAATHYPEEYALATSTMEDAEEDFSARRFEASFPKFRLVRDTLMDLQPVRTVQPRRQEMVTEPLPPREAAPRDVLPRYYVVRRIPEDRDTFNKIAGYDFVYGDRTRWRPLYEANRHILHDPDNPHLIHPGMRFEIPSLDGEEREGVWQPPN
ncbi:MAG: hypothetical protein EA427_04115 [Spirochaetaceae bacterium]|nr:MAG: hypothetical protein EA427_04115 [Spirochaetaceae bacterium]